MNLMLIKKQNKLFLCCTEVLFTSVGGNTFQSLTVLRVHLCYTWFCCLNIYLVMFSYQFLLLNITVLPHVLTDISWINFGVVFVFVFHGCPHVQFSINCHRKQHMEPTCIVTQIKLDYYSDKHSEFGVF